MKVWSKIINNSTISIAVPAANLKIIKVKASEFIHTKRLRQIFSLQVVMSILDQVSKPRLC